MNKEIKVRIAPSPTGFLHLGTAQSALYNWLFARKNGGKFLLRIEDTDRERSTKEYEQSIIESLKWLELDWDGEIERQSERNEKYKAALKKLIELGHVERKEFTEEEKATMLKDGKKSSDVIYIIQPDVSRSSEPIVFDDMIRGKISVEQKDVGPQVIARVPDMNNPDDIIYLYNFTVVVDDIDMNISHVIRGEDHISNTPKQLLIYDALDVDCPTFAHLPLILAPDRSKLSKRHGATSVIDYKQDYLPEALINFLGKLSFTFTEDILDREQMIKEFELAKVHKSGAVFDVAKLDWINGEYIKQLSDEDLVSKLQPFLSTSQVDKRILKLVRERIKKFSGIKEFEFFFKEPEYSAELLLWKKSKSRQEVLKSLTETKEIIEGSGLENLRKNLDDLAASKGGDRGLIYWPLRVALTGLRASPDPVEVAMILTKQKTLERVRRAIKKLD